MNQLIKECFIYPFKGSGMWMLFTGMILSIIAQFCITFPTTGIFTYIILMAYFCATYFDIIESTAIGRKEAPYFPGISNIVDDLFAPLFTVVALIIFCILPCLIYVIVFYRMDIIFYLLYILGFAYIPMALLAAVILGNLRAASPFVVLPAIYKAGGLYWVSVLLLFCVASLREILKESLGHQPILNGFILGSIGMYLLMVSGRIIGMVYREKEEEIDLFNS